MRKERLWMYMAELMLSRETSLSGTNMERSTNNGMSSTLMNGKENLERES